MKKYVTAVMVAAAFGAAHPYAQTQPVKPQPVEAPSGSWTVRGSVLVDGRDLEIQGRLMATRVESRVTTGKPYSAEAVTETTQTLSDGNRIERSTAVRIYRDGQGRTRRETIVDGIARTISISDPVGQVNYTLDPEKRTARKSGVAVFMPGGFGAGAGPAGGGGMVAPAIIAPQAPLVASNATSSASTVKKEELPPQNIDGVMARGERTTTVIPAGTIGNVNDIKIVSEQWFSDDLQVLVMTRHNDPRSGETVYRLRNIVRAEPDASLFRVPADYTEVTGGGGRGRGGSFD